MQIKLPWRNKQRERGDENVKTGRHAVKNFTVNSSGAIVVAGTLFYFPEPVITTAVALAVALSIAGYNYLNARKLSSKKGTKNTVDTTDSDILLELLKIKFGVYAILMSMLVGVICIISIKIVGFLAKAIDLLPVYIRLPWALALVVVLFVLLSRLGYGERKRG